MRTPCQRKLSRIWRRSSFRSVRGGDTKAERFALLSGAREEGESASVASSFLLLVPRSEFDAHFPCLETNVPV